MIDKEYDKVMDAIHNQMFIVTAPEILKYNEFERRMTNACSDIIDGETVDTSLQMSVYGMTLYDIAIHATDGFSIGLYNKNDFNTIYKLLKKYREYTAGISVYEVNMSERSIEEKELLNEFSKEVFAINANRLPNIVFDFKKMTKDLDIVIPDKNKKIVVTEHNKAKRIREW